MVDNTIYKLQHEKPYLRVCGAEIEKPWTSSSMVTVVKLDLLLILL